ncbi:zf-HC2 domain-containing protein [Brevibacillus migulae]|uniref:zf-HC2 domain-containing protein n=1 Tax=Brevibacillus migulae TaxID=1644114 RepID=UPI00106E92EF|nr:zf-HC2 domain-containing protein [Brevibacillus migulae]
METTCEEIQMSLPWLINGSLKATERVSVYAHLSRCAVCREEVSFLVSLQEAIAPKAEEQPAVTGMDTQLLFQAILEKIDQDQEEREPIQPVHSPRNEPSPDVLALIQERYRDEWDGFRNRLEPAMEDLRAFARIVRSLTRLAG